MIVAISMIATKVDVGVGHYLVMLVIILLTIHDEICLQLINDRNVH